MKAGSKKIFSLVLSLVMIFGCFSICASAVDHNVYYYVDSVNGDDSNIGTDINAPVKSIAGLGNIPLEAGINVLFKNGGVYECTVTLEKISGTKDYPFVISSYGEGEKAILRTDAATEVFRLFDCSYITISDVAISAPNGGGIWIDTLTETSEGIVLDNIYFYDMPNGTVTSRDDFSNGAARARAAVMVKGLPARSRYAVNDLTISNCEVYDCANGFMIWGSWNDEQAPWCEEEDIDPVFNTGILVENCYFHEMDAEAVVLGICDGALVTNCRAINCCQGEGVDENGEILYFTAAMWFWGSVNSTIEHCEIAGQKNVGDGMAIDFDSYSHNCTYQYIYSHDNTRFMCNNPNHSGHYNNTVRYCLSVNDNGGRTAFAVGSCGEHSLNFYNNTLVNCGEIQFKNLYDSYIANNIFVLDGESTIAYDLDNISRGNVFKNNCYYNVMTPLIDSSALNILPGFAGDDYSDAKSFMLADDSPLIGAGTEIEDDLTYDIFGNEITSANIGCYGGVGVETETEYEYESIPAMLRRLIKYIFETLIHEIYVIFDDFI